MSMKDHDKHFQGIQNAPTLASEQVPNTVSRNLKSGERAFHGVVTESGKPVLDAEMNLRPDLAWMENYLLRQWQAPSGWLRGRTHKDVYSDYRFIGDGVVDLSDTTDDNGASGSGDHLDTDDTCINSLVLPRIEALVAGHPIVVEYTNTSTAGFNLISLKAPTIYDGTNATVKRTDFVFLEVWRALVAPSPTATGMVQVVDASALANGDQILINGNPLTAVAAAPGVDEFILDPASESVTATNITNAINNGSNSFAVDVEAVVAPAVDTVTIRAVAPGLSGNSITLSVNFLGGGSAGSWLASGATLTGGSNRPGKPDSAQGKVYRHGNVQSPATTWLNDEMVDPAIDIESSQRIQIQYRIRTTSAGEAVNYKSHPDGFSNLIAGGGPNNPAIFAQGGRALPVWSGNGVDSNSYPFVRADKSSTWLQSSAVNFGVSDNGLWVAGNGSSTAASNLASIDGFVYAIPICFVHRHNNVSDALGSYKGFDPINNANGAPVYDHAGYSGPLGTIVAGSSDRPDGHFADVISQDNLLDLRRHVVFPGIDLAAELQYQMQSLLDGSLRTWSVDSASKGTLGGSSGDVSTRMMVCNEIGRIPHGSSPTSGDTPRGDFIRNLDHVARRFADQSIVERVVMAFYPGDRPGAGVQGGAASPGTVNPGKYVTKYEKPTGTVADPNGWYEGDKLVFDMEYWAVSTLGKVFQGTTGDGDSIGHANNSFLHFAPPNTVFSDVLGMWHDDGHYTTAVSQDAQAALIKGLGTTKVEITLDANGALVNEGTSGNPSHKMVGNDLSIVLSAVDVTFANTNPDTIIRNDAGNFITDGFVAGMTITVTNASIPANNGVYTIGVGGVAAGTLTLDPGDNVAADANDLTAVITSETVVPVAAAHLGSGRRIFVEFEITYPAGVGLTDTPDHILAPDPAVYNGLGAGPQAAGPGPLVENNVTQRPTDFDLLLPPKFREGRREVKLEYVANDTNQHGVPLTGAIGSTTTEDIVSNSRTAMRFPRRLYSNATGTQAGQTRVVDVGAGAPVVKTIVNGQTEYGSSSRQVVVSSNLSGTGQTLCEIEYFAQDPLPNYGSVGGGWQVNVYYRTNSPQTAGVKEGDVLSTGGGVLPTTLRVEPLLMSPNLWTGQTGVGSPDLGYPYAVPLDQIPVNDGNTLDPSFGTIKEWYFQAVAQVSIDDFNANTGLLALHPFIQGDVQNVLTLGGVSNDESPRVDGEFRVYYPFADDTTYRPTIVSQPLYGATRHKVMVPMLVRATEDVPGSSGGVLFRKGEILLIVLTRFAALDDQNNIQFLDTNNRTAAALYRTRNLLLVVGD